MEDLLSDEPAPSNLAEFTVSEISGAVKRTLEDAFGRVRVRGELSGYKQAASGHVYLTLKDDKAVLDGVIWRSGVGRLRFQPEDGLEVVCTGRITTYAGRSKYQLIIDSMEPAGVGALLALLEERRKKLAAEGLFDDERKQALPYLPEVIGVVTSPTGAVIRDILHRLRDRFPRHVLLWPVRVQGEGTAEEVAAAIAGFNALEAGAAVPRPDLLIVARGGGSIEDLWAFNEEAVVRAAAASAIPLISAVGHETDTTLIDFAADQRAPTPTAAAEMAVPVRTDLMLSLAEDQRQLIAAVTRLLADHRRAIDSLARGLPRPQAILGEAVQRLDDRTDNLRRMLTVYLDRRRARLDQAALKLKHPRERIAEVRGRLGVAAQALGAAGATRIVQARHALDRPTADRRLTRAIERLGADQIRRRDSAVKLLESFSYRNVLARGYAVVRDAEGGLVEAAAGAGPGAAIDIEFADGHLAAVTDAKPAPARKTRRRQKSDPDQGQLL